MQPAPTLNYDEAERVGVALKRRFKALTGKKKTPRLKDEQWADVTQFVLLRARDEIGQRPEREA